MGLELLQLVGYISLNEVISELELAIGLYPALCVCVSSSVPKSSSPFVADFN